MMKERRNIQEVRRMILLVTIYILHSSFFSLHSNAQGSDPGLVALIEVYNSKEKSMYKAQEAVQLLEATNHIWLNSETNAIYDLQKQFNDYIDTFRGVIVFAAQAYGFYYEKVY